MKCNLCSSGNMVESGIAGLKGVSVTSDSKLCASPAIIFTCGDCGHLQKQYSVHTNKLVTQVYEDYQAHHLSDGKEQLVFPECGIPKPRTYYAFEKCLPYLPDKGVMLDYGCGNGAVLKSASQLLGGWVFDAFDISDNSSQEILSIRGVSNFYACDASRLPCGRYDLIVLWHVLEHVTDLFGLFEELRGKLKDAGLLLLQVPDVERNPFDLAVIDHVSHFGNAELKGFCRKHGFSIVVDGYDWFHNCNTLLLKKITSDIKENISITRHQRYSCLEMLNKTVECFASAVKDASYALFGTGMASIWLSGELLSPPVVFLDEDVYRSGKSINHAPVVTPDKLPFGIKSIILPFPRTMSEKVVARLIKEYGISRDCNFIVPDHF